MKLKLKESGKEGLKVGITKQGKKYSVRDDRSRYFFPNEWELFMKQLRPKNTFIFEMLLQTGGRIAEILEIKPSDIDFGRNTLTLRVTKTRHKIGERVGRKRTFVISKQFMFKLKKYIASKKIKNDELLFTFGQKSVYLLLRRALVRAGIKDYYNFSLHNIRKTTGNWLKALGVPAEEICLRLGHDFNTYLKHYGSATIFDRDDRVQMVRIMGNLYDF